MRSQVAQMISEKKEQGTEQYLQAERRLEASPEEKKYGYVCVSSRENNQSEQVEMLKNAGIDENNIFIDSTTDKTLKESEYNNLLENLRVGDVLYITGLDKLGRSYEEVIVQWQMLTKIKKADVVVLNIPLLDTRVEVLGAPESFVEDLVVQFLTYVSMRERESIRQRQHDGIIAAQKRGVRFGRPPKPIPPQFDMLLQQWKNKEISSRKAAQQLGVAQETFLRWSRRRDS